MQTAGGLFSFPRQSFAVAAGSRTAAELFWSAGCGRYSDAPRKGPGLTGSPRHDPRRYGAILLESAVNPGRARSISPDGRTDQAPAYAGSVQAKIGRAS